MKELRVALAGLGTVGGGVWQNLKANAELIERRVDTRVTVTRVLCRRPDRVAELAVPSEIVVGSWQELVAGDEDVVVELMGGTDAALDCVKAALEAGKHVVTANKALLAAHGEELFSLAAKKQKQLLFEASVAGGIPFIKALREGLAANHIRSVHGIVNGTCNYILSRMADTGEDYAEVLADAKELGYAEADESLDVDGYDAAHKAAIIAALAYGFWVPEEQLYTEGITGVTRTDLQCAENLGYVIKHLAVIRQSEDGGVEVRVNPTLVPQRHILANVDGVFNAVLVTGDVVGETLYYGPGAGADATASAVLADVAEIAAHHPGATRVRAIGIEEICPKLKPVSEITTRYYLRLLVEDRPGVLAQIASILGERNIGISSVIQPESHEQNEALLIIMLHDAREADLDLALEAISGLPAVKAKPFRLRVEDFVK